MLLRIQEVENRVLGIIFIIYSVDNLGAFVDGPQDSFRASLSIQYSFFFFFYHSSFAHGNNIPIYKFSPFMLPHALCIYIISSKSKFFFSDPSMLMTPFLDYCPSFCL